MAKSYSIQERLDAFCANADSASSRRAIADGTLASMMMIVVAEGEKPEVEIDSGDEEDFRSLLMDVRKFTMQDATNFAALANQLVNRLNDPSLREAAKQNQKAWKDVQKGRGMLTSSDGQNVRADHMFEVVAYGGMFHHDPTKVAEWNALDDIDRGVYRTQVAEYLARCVDIARSQRNIIRAALAVSTIDLTD